MVVIEDGVLCAEWAPDDGVCVVVSGAGKVILMSEEFDYIKDTDARPQDFGTEHQTQVNRYKHSHPHSTVLAVSSII